MKRKKKIRALTEVNGANPNNRNNNKTGNPKSGSPQANKHMKTGAISISNDKNTFL
jgi:hypothetical protein